MTADDLFGPEEDDDEEHPINALFINMETSLEVVLERFRAMGLKV